MLGSAMACGGRKGDDVMEHKKGGMDEDVLLLCLPLSM